MGNVSAELHSTKILTARGGEIKKYTNEHSANWLWEDG